MVQPSAHAPESRAPAGGPAVLRYVVPAFSEDWIIREEPVPESAWHDGCLERIKALLDAWIARIARDAVVFRDIAVRVRRGRPEVGWNPDVCIVEPAPPGASELESLRLWEHPPPRFTFEAVSPNHPYKDHAIVPEKCAVAGVGELAVFDPLLAGPRSHGGPWLLQLWRRAGDGGFERVHAGGDAAFSEILGAWLVPDRVGRRLHVAGRANGGEPWLTREEQAQQREEQAQQREEQARQREEQARQREQDALRRVAELEAELRRR